MRLKLRWLVVLLTASLLMGAKSVVNPSNEQITRPNKVRIRQNRLAESLRTWNKLKAEHDDHYRYEVAEGFFIGFGYVTTITVRNGEVVARTSEYIETNDKGKYKVVSSWTEKGAAVGSHEEYGAAPRTIDEIYRMCRDDVLTRNPRANDIYLDIGDDGVLINCNYAPKGFAVDVAPGVNISALKFLSAKND